MRSPNSEIIEIFQPSYVGMARRAAKSLAERIGFELTACEEIASP